MKNDYNDNGQLKQVLFDNNEVIEIEYDRFGNVSKWYDSEAKSVFTWNYNDQNHLSYHSENVNGILKEYFY
jgi:hypothetical protein